MAKKGFLSWLGLGRSANEAASPVDAAPEAPELDPSRIAEVDESIASASAEAIQDAEPFIAEETEPQPETEAEAEVEVEVEASTLFDAEPEAQQFSVEETVALHPETQDKPKTAGFFGRLVQGLMRTRENIGAGFLALFRGKKLDDELFEELETQLLTADLGVETASRIIRNLTEQASFRQLKDAEALYDLLKQEMADILKPVDQPLVIDGSKRPHVILMVGVNGVGKTTTIGKLAKRFQQEVNP